MRISCQTDDCFTVFPVNKNISPRNHNTIIKTGKLTFLCYDIKCSYPIQVLPVVPIMFFTEKDLVQNHRLGSDLGEFHGKFLYSPSVCTSSSVFPFMT